MPILEIEETKEGQTSISADIKAQLAEIQNKLKVPKNQFSKFGNYHYRSTDDILEKLKPILLEYQAQMTITDEAVVLGNSTYIKATVDLYLGPYHYQSTGYAREQQAKKGMDDAQLTGSTSSYARKYALNGLFLIDDAKDVDSDAYSTGNRGKTTAPKAKESPEKVAMNYKVKDAKGEVLIVQLVSQAMNKDQAAAETLHNLKGKDRRVYDYIVKNNLWKKWLK